MPNLRIDPKTLLNLQRLTALVLGMMIGQWKEKTTDETGALEFVQERSARFNLRCYEVSLADGHAEFMANDGRTYYVQVNVPPAGGRELFEIGVVEFTKPKH